MPVVFKAPPLPVLFTVAEAPPMTRIQVCCEVNFTRKLIEYIQNVQASNNVRIVLFLAQVASGVNAQLKSTSAKSVSEWLKHELVNTGSSFPLTPISRSI